MKSPKKSTSSQNINIAIKHHKAAQYAEAATLYAKVLAHDPQNFDALHLLGVLAHQMGRSVAAADLIGKAIMVNDRNPLAFVNLAEVYRALNRLLDAEYCYRLAVTIDPCNADAYGNLGNLLQDLGNSTEAEASYLRALTISPQSAQVWSNFGALLHKTGRPEDAEVAYRRAVAIDPNYADAYNNLSALLIETGRREEAVTVCSHALEIRPDFAGAYYNLGAVLHKLDRLEEAETAYRRALAIEPDNADIYCNLGVTLKELGRQEESIATFRLALCCNPAHYSCLIKLATASIPIVLASVDRNSSVAESFSQSLDELEEAVAKTPALLGKEVGSSQPFFLAYRLGDHTRLLSRYGDIICRARQAWLKDPVYTAQLVLPRRDRLRLVVVTGHVRRHSVWDVLLHGLLHHLDHSRFEVIVYHTSPATDTDTSIARTLVDRFVQGPKEWLLQVANDAPDILFYPEIGMDANTLELASLRLAPLQVASWGHPITTGLPTIDLFFSGELIERTDAEKDYRERLVRLPGTGACTLPMPMPKPPASASVILPEDRTITRFLVCQQILKFDPVFDNLFPLIALASGACRFWFMRDPKYRQSSMIVMERLKSAFKVEGLDPEKYICFIDWLPGEQFWGMLDVMDVYLDTPAFSGYTTAWQAIHRGLPVVTLEGEFMRQRLAAGLLRQVGITETIASNVTSYVSIAAALSSSPGKRQVLGERLRKAAPLADNDLNVVRAFEEALRKYMPEYD